MDRRAAADLANYRTGYPGRKLNDKRLKDNLRFYSGALPSVPDGASITTFHRDWWGESERLEEHHGYIQWLFPIHESSPYNPAAQVLQRHEAASISSTPKLQARVLRSYELMLHFFGMRLVDKETGTVARRAAGWKRAYANLNSSMHNFLRVTRILKSLGELGLEHLKKPWLQFIAEEVYVSKLLENCRESLQEYWVPTLRDVDELDTMRVLVGELERMTDEAEEAKEREWGSLADRPSSWWPESPFFTPRPALWQPFAVAVGQPRRRRKTLPRIALRSVFARRAANRGELILYVPLTLKTNPSHYLTCSP